MTFDQDGALLAHGAFSVTGNVPYKMDFFKKKCYRVSNFILEKVAFFLLFLHR